MSAACFPQIDGLSVDLVALASISHRCDPSGCSPSAHCCSAYDLWVSGAEADAVAAHLSAVAEFARHLAGATREDVLQRLAEDAYAVRRDRMGRCLLAYDAADGSVLCSLHTVAERRCLPLRDVKPEPCRLWPLSTTSSIPPVLGVQEGAMRYPCNRARDAALGGLDPAIAGILRDVFGTPFLRKVARLLGSRSGEGCRGWAGTVGCG
jgi:hypothetical protein